MNIKYLCVACGVLLLIAIPNWLPYGFYTLLRWIISISSIYVAIEFNKSQLQGWTYVFGALALLFNPIFPFYLTKSNWVTIDFISAIIFFISAYSVKKTK